jgi:hypothetical protein
MQGYRVTLNSPLALCLLGDEDATAASAYQDASLAKRCRGALDGRRGDAVVVGQLAAGGQLRPWRELVALDPREDVRDQLFHCRRDRHGSPLAVGWPIQYRSWI